MGDSHLVRFHALDAFRGITIALMILVNTPGDWGHVYTPLLHADWHGWTPTDLVFPFFLFIVGAAIYFSFSKQEFKVLPGTINKVIKRTIIMFLIGLSLNVYNYLLLDSDSLRIMGVLQRIAICYCAGALLVLYCSIRQLYIVAACILVGYYSLFIIFAGEQPFLFENSIISSFDKLVLGEAHMWKMRGVAFDPEGLLSTVPAVVTLLFGFETARRLMQANNPEVVTSQLLIYGVVLIGIAYLVSLLMPINKNIWSSSYVLLTSGLALLLLALFVWLIDVKGYMWIAKPWQIYGMNPLFVYCLSWLMASTFWAIPVQATGSEATPLYTYLWQSLLPLFSEKMASLIYAVVHVFFFWLVSYVLYRKKIIIKI